QLTCEIAVLDDPEVRLDNGHEAPLLVIMRRLAHDCDLWHRYTVTAGEQHLQRDLDKFIEQVSHLESLASCDLEMLCEDVAQLMPCWIAPAQESVVENVV